MAEHDTLNPEQKAAALASDGPLLVLAAAGTGKTRTLVHRLAYLVEQGIPPGRILLLTFTNRAAREMLERAVTLVGNRVSGFWGGTFHHLSNRILRTHAQRLGYKPDYTILDRDDSKSLVTKEVKRRKLNTKEFPKPDVLLDLFGNRNDTGESLEKILMTTRQEYSAYAQEILELAAAYETQKKAMMAMDFDDLLLNGLRLFDEHPDILEYHQDMFLHVLVDEYQDTNRIQAALVDRVAGRHRNVMAVGDDFQCIYSWRGADFKNIMTFPERYPDARTFLLETNYRSTPEILDVANACIAGNPEQFQKHLRSVRPASKRPTVAYLWDGYAQVDYVLAQIRRWLGSGMRPEDIAVLYRAHYHAMELQIHLTRSGLPYTITSGLRFFEQAHIKDVCALLRLMVNPRDMLSLGRVLELFPGVGPRTVDKVFTRIRHEVDLFDKTCRDHVAQGMRPEAQDLWNGAMRVFEDETQALLRSKPERVIEGFLKGFYERHLADAYADARRRTDEVNELRSTLGHYVSLEAFLNEMALMTDREIEQAPQGDAAQGIRLSTVHQAKGLEWRGVIMVWVTENMFPSPRAVEEADGDDSEERRLFYVAVTRARDELVMCVPKYRQTPDGKTIPYLPSRFIMELPEKVLRVERGSGCY